MFDGKIDLSDFDKVNLNYGGKITGKKMFELRFILFFFIYIIIIVSLSVILYKKKEELNQKSYALSQRIQESAYLQRNITSLSLLEKEEQEKINERKEQIEKIKQELDPKKINYENLLQEYKQKEEQRNILEKKSASLSLQLKTETELEDVYQQKISSLNNLLSSLKKEYQKLLEQNKNEENDDNHFFIDSSKIINEKESENIKQMINCEIKEKCFDFKKNGFDSKKFHDQCDGSGILVLLETENKERIGAISSVSFDGNQKKQDPRSALFNIDDQKFYILADSEYFTIICDQQKFPQFGNDFIISNDGTFINNFPYYYGDKIFDERDDLSQEEESKIIAMEIYKVDVI